MKNYITKKAIIVLSGGLDSCVTTAIARAEGYELALLHLNYGQRTEARELQAFNDIADFYDIGHRLVTDISYLAAIGGSSLTDKSMAVEEAEIDQARQAVPSTYVPFRNGNILSIAVSWAEVIHATDIFIGAVEEDSSGYPDCREIFYDKFNALLACGLPEGVRIQVGAPLIHLSKAQIVQRGIELGAPLHLTWSCYQGEAAACGICESCRLRLRGFEQAGVKDPIKYLIR
ncbi:MAG: 7-cyano-7-deazaguanine synthase QueC [Deferribacteraceae bacterium]|jgi:7-cyano-7-deazaguanine synthase|nr:7-cyano-7-deazaguanine synthase QueC [Deferribacteraceae bacterium]